MDAIYQAKSRDQIAAAVPVFVEYAESLDYELCFKGLEDELAGLPSGYLRRIVGLDGGACELKALTRIQLKYFLLF